MQFLFRADAGEGQTVTGDLYVDDLCLTEEDNFQNGILGLFTAVQRFDALQGYSFLTYAAYWIRQSILREAINTGLTVRIPVHYFDTLCRVRVVCSTCMQLDGPDLWQRSLFFMA